MLGNFTIIDAGVDKWLLIFNLLAYMIIAAGWVLVVYISRKMNERLRNSFYCVLLSVVIAGFFRIAVLEYFTTLLGNIGFALYQCYIFTMRALAQHAMALIMFAALVACPLIFKIAEFIFGKRKPDCIRTKINNFLSAFSILFTDRAVKPSFHFIS